MIIPLHKITRKDSKFHKKDAAHLCASLSNHKLSIVGYIVYFKDGRRYDFKFQDIYYFKLECPIDFAAIIDAAYKYQHQAGHDLKDLLAQTLIENCATLNIEFKSGDNGRMPAKAKLTLGNKTFTAREFEACG